MKKNFETVLEIVVVTAMTAGAALVFCGVIVKWAAWDWWHPIKEEEVDW